MGRRAMGNTLRGSGSGGPTGHKPGWRKDDPRSQDQYRAFLAGGERTRFKRKNPLPSLLTRFGSLTVVGFDLGDAGGLKAVVVACDCGAPAHRVDLANLLAGRSKQCNACARKSSALARKNYWKYADVVPDTEHRRRLLNRLAAAIGRCHRPTDQAWANYGGRGIVVSDEWREPIEGRRRFLRHVVTLSGWDNPSLDIDRINTDGNYAPGNIRFVTRKENQGNKRKVQELQREVDELRARLRSCKCGAASALHDPD